MNIAFFGASVTKQTNSYADYVGWELNANYKKFGYGSMHLSDAGVCFVDEVVKNKPEICFLDWFSTSKTDYGEKINDYLDAIIYKLYKNNIKPVFLLFPISEMLQTRLEMYDNIRKYADIHNIFCVDVYSKSLEDKIPIKDLIKDYVHTTGTGAKYYAKTIIDSLNHNVINLPNKPLHSNYNPVCPAENKYCKINKTILNVNIKKYIELLVEEELIGIYQKVGPYSGYVEIYKDDVFFQKINVWDVWCYYERETIKINIKNPGRYKIKVTDEKINKSNCKIQLNWNDYTNSLFLNEFYHLKGLEILSYE